MTIQIINPKTGRKVNIDSTLGKFILKNYYDSQQGSGLFDKKCNICLLLICMILVLSY